MEDGAIQRAMTAGFDPVRSSLLAAVDDAVARLAVETLTLPHVIWVLDHHTGQKCCLGPFGSPIDACVYAEQVVAQIVGEGSDASGFEVEVVPLDAVSVSAHASTGPAHRRSVTSFLRHVVDAAFQHRRSLIEQEPAQHS